MEDAATSEIARSQVWQWVHHGAKLKDGPDVNRELVSKVEDEELDKIRQAIGHDAYAKGRFDEARAVFDEVALGDDLVEFLTIPAYALLD
jgi:malate synthase